MAQINSLEAKLRMGASFSASSNLTSIGIGSNFRFLAKNPSGSDRNVFIYAVTANNTLTANATATLVANPTGNLPTTAVASISQDLSAPNTSVLVVTADAGSAISGGTSKYSLVVPPGRTVYDQEILKIPPGYSLGINAPFTVAGTASLQLYFWEEPISSSPY